MKLKKYVSFLLMLILLASALIACKDTQSDTDASEQSVATEEDILLTIASNGESEYTIWYASGMALSYDVIKQIDTIKSTLKSKTGAELAVKKDNLYNAQADADKPAILIGDTVFEESKAMAEKRLKLGDYYVGSSGNKIIIYSNTDGGYINAIRYFVNKVISTQSDENKTVYFTDEHIITNKVTYGIDSIKCAGVELCDFNIVISRNADINESMFAKELRQYLVEQYGYELQIVKDSISEAENEILIGKARTTADGPSEKYGISEENGKLRFFADGMLGYNSLLEYVKNTLWKSSKSASYTLDSGYSFVTDISLSLNDATVLSNQKYGDIRCMFYNVYGYEEDAGPMSLRQSMQAEIIDTYAPDVVAFQEYAPAYHLSFTAKMTELGYTQVKVSLGTIAKNNWTPLFYNAEKLDVVDKGYYLYSGTNNENSKSVTWAVFKDKTTGEQALVMGTHFMWNQPGVSNPNALRTQNATELVAKINEIKASYSGIPIVIGGDLNCIMNSDPTKVLTGAGLSHAWERAEVKNNSSGHHGYSTYDAGKEIYTAYFEPTGTTPYIDHVYVQNVTVKAFATATDKYSLICSDHSPVIVDISI